MAKASQVAAALRIVADSFDKAPNVEIGQLALSRYYVPKDAFLALARILPRPIEKVFTENTIELTAILGGNEALRVTFEAERSEMCVLVTPAQPAVYDCLPLLSEEEESSL